MFFDEPAESFDQPIDREMTAILTGTSLVVLLFVLALSPVLSGAEVAAAALFPG